MVRAWLLVVVLGFGWLGTPWQAAAQAQPGTVRFTGQVVSVDGPSHNPTGFTLQLANRTLYLRVAPRATFKANSAEAEVEGFQASDYAMVDARHQGNFWIAYTIAFDVQPVRPGPRQTMVSGMIQRVSANGLRFLLRLDTGDAHWITISKKTRFRVDGQISALPPVLQRGQSVDVLVIEAPRGWVAVEVNLRTGAPPFQRVQLAT